ncbi:fucolectin-1-like [Ylistrum balloti]|uniref:fucolectin-1-like n=1 Tax=Ylistrum balloti TaxID=509963 RepID=UPI002905E9AA|nr:fucolectin-1-like [Ylistrum balloti]
MPEEQRTDIKNTFYRIDERYGNQLPVTGILWKKTGIVVRWCLYECLLDADCVATFFNNGTCHGYPEKIHDFIEMETNIGTSYYELAGPVGNVAAGKPAIQSSYIGDTISFGPDRALDSVRSPKQDETDPSLISCAHTADVDENDADHNPYWQVDLKSRHLVLSISFLSRYECCGDRNTRLNITVAKTDTGPRALCVYYPGPPFQGQMKTFFCEKPVIGQFVRISRDRINLNPCEVEVYGFPLA